MRKLPTINDGVGCPPIRSDDALIAQGWRRRYLADRPRADEAREMYTGLGYEVVLRNPEPSQLRAECDGCRQVACTDYFIVYTRKRDDRE